MYRFRRIMTRSRSRLELVFCGVWLGFAAVAVAAFWMTELIVGPTGRWCAFSLPHGLFLVAVVQFPGRWNRFRSLRIRARRLAGRPLSEWTR